MSHANVINRATFTSLIARLRLASLVIMAMATCLFGTSAVALSLTVDQAKVSNLLLNTSADPTVPATYGTGTPTIFGYAETIITTNTNALATNPSSSVPTALVNGTVVDGVNTIAVKSDTPLSASSTTIPGLYRINFTLTGSGNPVFNAPVDATRIKLISSASTNCTISAPPFVIDGGNTGQYYVTYQFTLSTACSATDAAALGPIYIAIDTPWRLKNVGEAIVSVTLSQDPTGTGTYATNYVTVGTATRTLARAIPAVSLSLSKIPAPVGGELTGNQRPTQFAFGNPPYTALNNTPAYDNIIGSYRVGVATVPAPYAGTAAAGGTPVVYMNLGSSALTTISQTNIAPTLIIRPIGGSWNGYTPVIAGLTPTVTSDSSYQFNGASTSGPVSIALSSPATPKSQFVPLGFYGTLSAAVSAGLGITAPAPITNFQFETANLEGTTFRVPWFGGSLASTPSLMRLVNDGATPTGPIYIYLAAPSPTITVPDSGCKVSDTLAPGAEYLFGSDQAFTCFGSFVRGDLLVATQAASTDLIVKTRVVSQGNYVAELSVEPITLTGSGTTLTWFGGAQALTPSLVRVSNISNASSGPITLTLANTIDGTQTTAQTCDSSTLGLLSGVPANGELLIGTGEVSTCFGSFRRGDLTIAINGNASGLSTRMRVTSGAGASAAEQTIGTLPADQLNNAKNGLPVQFTAAWFGGPLAATPSILRLSNSNTTSTGPISLTLNNITNGTNPGPITCTATQAPILASVPARSEILIDTTVTGQCFGNFRRGDLVVQVNGGASGLTAKMRVISSAQAIVTEQLLGPRCTDGVFSTCAMAPWFEGPKSSNQSVLRIANSANTQTGAVTLTLRNSVEANIAGTQFCNSSKLASLAGIPAQGELVIDVNAAKTCFGDFRRGDIFATVAAPNSGIYPMARLISAAGNMVSDQSINRTVTGLGPIP